MSSLFEEWPRSKVTDEAVARFITEGKVGWKKVTVELLHPKQLDLDDEEILAELEQLEVSLEKMGNRRGGGFWTGRTLWNVSPTSRDLYDLVTHSFVLQVMTEEELMVTRQTKEVAHDSN